MSSMQSTHIHLLLEEEDTVDTTALSEETYNFSGKSIPEKDTKNNEFGCFPDMTDATSPRGAAYSLIRSFKAWVVVDTSILGI